MKKLLGFILLSIMVPQLAFASYAGELKTILDDYTYSMEVQWDQNDQAFASQKRKEFISKLEVLINHGLSENDIIEASGVKLEDLSKEVLLRDLTNAKDIADFLSHHREFQKGANWSGDVVLASIFFTPIIVMIGLMIHGSLTREQRLNRIDSCLATNTENQDHCFDLI
jgi:hypothetical protein